MGVLPELVLSLADYGLVGTSRWRPDAYQYAAFWSGLLEDWTPNYSGQPALMYVSYWLLHADPVHMLGNMAALIWLGYGLGGRVTAPWFLLVYLLSAVGGGVAFGLLNHGYQPMIGASGAIFGLAGLWVVLERERHDDRWAVGVALILVAMNTAIWILEAGRLAWESHLGGFVVGASLGLLILALRPPSAAPAKRS